MMSDPAFWVLVAFVIFVALVWKPLGAMITGTLDERAAKIKADLDRAAGLREEAQNLLAQYQRKHRDAMQEAEAIIAQARAEAERIAKQAAGDLEASLKRRELLALQRIQQSEAQATSEVRAAAVDVAMEAAAKLIGEKLDQAGHAALIDRSLGEITTNRLQ